MNKTPIEEKSDSQIHYEELRKFFQYLLILTVGVISIILTVAGIFFYSNMNEIKTDIKDKVGGLETSAVNTITESKKLVSNSISDLRIEASQIARTETIKKVEEGFRSHNITNMIDSVAKKELNSAIQKRIADLISPKMIELTRLSDIANKMRRGYRSALDEFNKFISSTEDEAIKSSALEILSRISIDYDTMTTNMINERKKSNLNLRGILNVDASIPDSLMINKIIQFIDNANDLSDVAFGFIILRDNYKVNIKMFDFKYFNEWKKEYLKKDSIKIKKTIPGTKK